VKVDTAAKERKDLGMFYLKNPSINPSEVFPKVMPEKICTNFTCTARVRSAAMLHVTSSIPGSHPSSNTKLSS
jgi:hypothetical protein